MLELGKVMIETKRYANAEEIFLQLIEKYPDNIDALIKLAFLAYSREDFSLAELYLNKVLSLDQNNPSALQNIKLIKRKALKGNSSLNDQ